MILEPYSRCAALVVACVVSAVATVQAGQPAVFSQITTLEAADGRDVNVRLLYPRSGCDYCDVIIFSHGALATHDRYDALLEAWAAAGFIVAAPLHVDSEAHPRREEYGQQQSLPLRVDDYEIVAHAVIDGVFSADAPISVSGTLIAAGHSFGAMIAQLAGGATTHEAVGALGVTDEIAGPEAVIAISPPGPIPNYITAAGWSGIDVPMLVVTGTEDVLPGFIDDWRQHLVSFEAARAAPAYAVIFEGVDHYFNGAYGRIADSGDAAAPQIARLNSVIIDFITAATSENLPVSAAWTARSDEMMTAHGPADKGD